MGLLKSATEEHQEKLLEELLYSRVAEEIESRKIFPGLWTKAFADAGGDENQAKARYIKSRVDMLKSMAAAEAEQTRRFEQSALRNTVDESKRRNQTTLPSAFMKGAKDGAREVYQEFKDGNDFRQPKKFVKYHWGQFKTTMFLVACFFAYILFTGIVRGW